MPNQIYKHLIIGINSDKNTSKVLPVEALAVHLLNFPGSSVGKESACKAGDAGSIPGLGRSPGEGNGNPLQYSCLVNPMDRGAWRATVHRVTKNQTQLRQLITHSTNFSKGLKKKETHLTPTRSI